MKRPPKPRIVKPRLLWRWSASAWAWVPYHRTVWREDGKQKAREIKLDWQGDPQELDRLYWKCQSGAHERQQKPDRYTWGECIAAWKADRVAGMGKLKDSTKPSYLRTMDTIAEKNGGKDMRRTTRQAVRAAVGKLQDTPRKAQRMAQTISLLWNYAAQELDWPLGPNPAAKLSGKYAPARPFQPWPAWMVAKLDEAPPAVQIAARLILGTGQRPGAAIAMQWADFDGEWMTVEDEKGDQRLEVYAPESLRAYLGTVGRKGAHVLAKSLRQPYSYAAVEGQFRTWRKHLGDTAKPFSLHGLRKLAIVELAEAGASDAEIQAVTGQSAQTVAYYRKEASRRRLSKAAQKRRR
ncbi:hypothetical protein KU6B_48220 [Mameliella alba]|uniref:tyrosine-type recombinase/integrase n=1 Tax=Mameliella alba TaxID=561184 RepID=UPI0013E48E11|nr:tyrosine-type recombinase/integrase [Mameliella alba]BBU58557.1 hypothetical protein KU6B_48220 [Mameliella alba]